MITQVGFRFFYSMLPSLGRSDRDVSRVVDRDVCRVVDRAVDRALELEHTIYANLNAAA